MSKNVAEIMVDALQKAGAKRVYGIPGDTINHFTTAVAKSDLRWIGVRHEEVGAFAAGGESYMTGELSICAGTCGPGSLHFVNGIYESHRNGAPVVLIASDVARTESGFNFPQEVDQKKIYEQHSHFCEYISHPSQARRIVTKAAQAALTKKGVAVVIVNGDMFTETDDDAMDWEVYRPQPVCRPSDAEMAELAALVDGADKVSVYAGIGARDAREEIMAFCEKVKAPMVHTTRAKEFLEPNNPYNVGVNGILGNKAGVEALEDADLVITLGCDFAYTQYYPEAKKIVQIDIDPTHLGRRSAINLGLVGDAKTTFAALTPLVAPKTDDSHLQAQRKQWGEDLKGYDNEGEESDPTLIHPQFVANMLDGKADDDAIFVSDVGTAMVWMLRHLKANGKRRFLNSLLHGTMASGMPQAIGAKLAYPERQVIAMCGDGGLTMLMGDLLTLVQEDIPLKLVVFHNNTLGFVEMEQRVEGLVDHYTTLHNPDFAKLAEACGFAGWHVEKADALEPAMDAWLQHDGPALLDVHVNQMELVMPPKIEASQVASTALFGVKAVLDGRTREVVDLLKNNFLR
ncbi:thiamine pyrophosphate-dependent enzyme [Altericroceibacterium endophyticum]|uniref:Ubiquinone-dependent pyruvate dehydrogenase n=1 Tax=Altericroceibacterium endophyticum TaxID=1808508 RepID=A0A6I4T9D2_9SPHN|nr:thiamine pyrophosphate-dependent enzyme [Altericroceibacterium endophyticum]MXO67009.1 ubiquinone-dependent pyruvate dehydrogenase [Altericroceibacterium endophyticum]